jgi:hypothetical protein
MRAVDIDLRKHRKAHIVGEFAETRNLGRIAWLLPGKLVAGKAKQDKAPVFEVAIEPLKPRVLRSEPAFTGGVDDEHYLAAIGGNGHRLACYIESAEIVDRAHDPR